MSDDRSMEDAVSSPNTEITALAQQVATARGKLPLQHDTALYDALSDAEIRAERELAEWIRAQRRKQRRHAVADELAAEQRDRRTGALIRRADEADARWHRKALAARRRVSSADARLAQLYRRAEWSSRALIGVVILGMVWAGVNVQHNLVPSGDMSDPLYWLSFGIEAMISIPIITIMVAATTAARWGRELERGKVLLFELALLGTTVALNAGPHLASGSFGRAAEYAIAPVMVGVVIWLHAWVSARYALLIEGASVELPGEAGYSAAERVMSMAGVSSGAASGPERIAVQDGSMPRAVGRESVGVVHETVAGAVERATDAAAHETGTAANIGAVGHDTVAGAHNGAVERGTVPAAHGTPTDANNGTVGHDTVAAAHESSAAANESVAVTHDVAVEAEALAAAHGSGAAAHNGAFERETVTVAHGGAVGRETVTVAHAGAVGHGTVSVANDVAGTSATGQSGVAADKERAAMLAGAAQTSALEPQETSVAQVVAPVTTAMDYADSEASTLRDAAPELAAAQVDSGSVETLAGRGQLTHGLRRPSADKVTAPGTLELIHKAAAEYRRNGDHARVNGAVPTLRRIPVTAAAQPTAGEATGTDPVPEATAHAGSVARDRNGDTAAPTESVVVHNDPQAPVDVPEQLTLTPDLSPTSEQLPNTGPAQRRTVREPAPKQQSTKPAAAPRSEPHLTAAATVSTQLDSASVVEQQPSADELSTATDQLTNSVAASIEQRLTTESAASIERQVAQSAARDGQQQATESAARDAQQLDAPEAVTPESESPSRVEPSTLSTRQPTKVAAMVAAPASEQLPEPVEPDLDDEDADDLIDEYDFDDDTEVRALARQIAHRSPLRLTLDQIEEILELTDQSWSARSIGAEVGVSGSTVTNIVEFARKIRQPYAFTG
ncbi:hypothetical protein ATM97_23890 [Nocardia sp. MH4]|uniref:helix-turn-helix domain-containing protein n=1 Tax=Nocardia sp. MH4 TaxID=1768677 RepID=UPI001C4F8CAA|nr:helix-turn-helix domain-containing protein [Nocardia sp. MH4]MBW0273129.1 hypothetical protein [Nocardia sp. MH4]